MLKTTAAPTRLDRRNSRQHLDRVPVLPTHGTVSNWGPFQRDVVTSVPPRVVVYTTCVVLSLFLVACGVVVTSSNKEPGFASSGSLNLDAGVTHGGRQLTQWLAPVWYSLPTLFDSLYNLGESLVRLGITPEEYRVAAEINAEAERERALETEQYEDEYSYASNAVDEPADENPNDGFDTWPGYDMYDGKVRRDAVLPQPLSVITASGSSKDSTVMISTYCASLFYRRRDDACRLRGAQVLLPPL
jgi:hypothetical protein